MQAASDRKELCNLKRKPMEFELEINDAQGFRLERGCTILANEGNSNPQAVSVGMDSILLDKLQFVEDTYRDQDHEVKRLSEGKASIPVSRFEGTHKEWSWRYNVVNAEDQFRRNTHICFSKTGPSSRLRLSLETRLILPGETITPRVLGRIYVRS
ncbi:hypothetical protein Tco_1069766 [Tanacetum coccineum]|uniref:Uncharacterized protein n=1 Tax=Tanacetum coccineum TaxID=301880 RepID=A0ABQ5HKV4_9ASTR